MKEKKNKIIIFLIIIILLLIGGIIYLLFINKPKENITTTNTENTEKKYTLTVYKYSSDSTLTKDPILDSQTEESYKEKAFDIPTKTNNAYIINVYGNNYVLYKDKYIYLYDHNIKESKQIHLNEDDYNTIYLLPSEKQDEIKGLCYITPDNKMGFYNTKINKKLYDKKYSAEYGFCQFNILGNYIEYTNDEDGSIYLLNVEEEKIELSYTPPKEIRDNYGIYITSYGYDNNYIYALVIGNYATKLYSSKLKEFYDNQISEYLINAQSNKVSIADGKDIKEYNYNGEHIKTYSKEGTIYGIYNNHYLYVKDNKLILENIKDSTESVTLTNWSSKWTVNLSGYWTRDELDKIEETHKKQGLYIIIEYDKKDSKGNYGMEYCYTDDKKVIEYPIKEEFGGRAKPVLYLYPTEKTNIKVTFEHPEYLTTTYPKYTSLWDVTAYPNGDLYDKDGKYYYALYWDETRYSEVSFNEGFYVEAKDAIRFLEEKLTIIGLNQKERNEFIMYWLPILERNKKSIVYFELTKERESNNKLIITPTPDSLLRVNIHIKKVNQKTNIKEQKLNTFKRFGFTAIEWGGMTY